jgi:hypothetical protein
MISNTTADEILDAATAEKRRSSASGHEFQPSYNQPLGYHVFTVAMAVAPDHCVPYSASLEESNDRSAIRDYILRAGE